jgi:hypothetical protein
VQGHETRSTPWHRCVPQGFFLAQQAKASVNKHLPEAEQVVNISPYLLNTTIALCLGACNKVTAQAARGVLGAEMKAAGGCLRCLCMVPCTAMHLPRMCLSVRLSAYLPLGPRPHGTGCLRWTGTDLCTVH